MKKIRAKKALETRTEHDINEANRQADIKT